MLSLTIQSSAQLTITSHVLTLMNAYAICSPTEDLLAEFEVNPAQGSESLYGSSSGFVWRHVHIPSISEEALGER